MKRFIYKFNLKKSMRKKGDYDIGYRVYAKQIIKPSINEIPCTVNAIKKRLKKNGVLKSIHHITLKRMLLELRENGEIRSRKVGKTEVWYC